MFDLIKNMFLLLVVVGGAILFILLAPFLIWAVAMLISGAIAFCILAFIIYAIWEGLKEG